MKKTGFVFHELYTWHDTGNYAGFLAPGFPLQPGLHNENPETKRRFNNLLVASGLSNRLTPIEPREATEEEIMLFHTPDYVRKVKALSDGEGGDAGELTHVGKGSYEIAKLSAGGVIEAVNAVMSGKCDNAYALVRPPGHHADADTGRGFCIFGNVVIAARYALKHLNTKKIAVVDWDVHHGNGTETAFYNDPNVLTISLHQDNWYPQGRGLVADVGEGDGEGYNINLPLPPGSGVGAYKAAFERVVAPALRTFQPDLIFVASGFDASAFDPLGRQMMHSRGYAELTKIVMDAADDVCGGKIVMCHEGGYSAYYVPFCGLAVLEQLSGVNSGVEDPYLDFAAGMAKQDLQPAQNDLISEVESICQKYRLI
ncbi:class II histone deacetylase [Emcibacter nanhaiensis]|uniref:Class II histone deacetylase n=1 Tax=Emcibacter nanhaiensis TaxID=1505037 RepID=A0A501PJH8_9PROT|nr:class II histone deacetylase [Emcibacter nanhaiensis]TPD60198.1 class II histone deacetylase [Emcibacter nanhaiensis]